MQHFRILAALLALAFPAAAEPLASFQEGRVAVTIGLEPGQAGSATLVAVLTPDPAHRPRLHLYSPETPDDAVGAGLPSRLRLASGGPARAAGPLAWSPAAARHEDALVFPPGPVTLRLPIRLPAGPAPTATVGLLVTYLACEEGGACQRPVLDRPVAVALPTAADGGGGAPAPEAIDASALRRLVAEETARALVRHEAERSSAIRWRHPQDPAEAEAAIRDAHAAGRTVLLDFTGRSCVSCQLMEKTVLRVPAVVAAWNAAVPLRIDTDPPRSALADWQQRRFQAQYRPMYVFLAPDGRQAAWGEVFAPGDTATVDRFVSFLRRGDGDGGRQEQGLGGFLLLAVLGGLFTLLMPCTYPMIPFTVNFFAKQAAGGRRLLPLAIAYGAGIIACFVGLGVLVTGVLGASLATLSGHPLTNLAIALLFAVLGLSLLGAFLLRLPAGFEDRLGGGRAGYLGALLMGLTFAVTAFTCTAPFAGSVLAGAVAHGTWGTAVLGMGVYALTIAVPFVVLALAPGLMRRLPRSGAWMEEFKHVGGLVELAAALKFLVICDLAWGWGVFGRSSVLAAWAGCALLLGLHSIGVVRLKDEEPVAGAGTLRTLLAIVWFAAAIWLASGLAGNQLGIVESFFPE